MIEVYKRYTTVKIGEQKMDLLNNEIIVIILLYL
jgi:hypothetical protein